MKRKLCILCCIAIIISMVGCTSEKKETNEQYLEKIENVTYQDIVDVCQNIELDTIFLLKGRNE